MSKTKDLVFTAIEEINGITDEEKTYFVNAGITDAFLSPETGQLIVQQNNKMFCGRGGSNGTWVRCK